MPVKKPNKPGRSVQPNAGKIVELRSGKGWNQEDLAEKADVSKRTIEKVETGTPINLRTIAAVAKAFGIAVEEIIVLPGSGVNKSTVLPDLPGAWSEADELFEKEYVNAAFNALNHLELIGADIEHDVRCSELLQAFVMLNLDGERREQCQGESIEGEEEVRTSGGLVSARTTFNRILQPSSGRLLIRGSAGMGKTTLIKWAAITALGSNCFGHRNFREPIRMHLKHIANRSSKKKGSIPRYVLRKGVFVQRKFPIERYVYNWSIRTPFVVFLRNFNGIILPVEHFTHFAGSQIGQQPPRWVERVLRAGLGLVFLDGIDI